MKILEIQGQVEGGGSERHTFILARALRDRGHEVILCVPETSHQMIDEMIEDGFVVERFPTIPTWRRIVNVRGGWFIKKVIERHGIDLVHSHLFNSDVMGLIGARLARIPVVTTMHGATLGPHLERTLKLRAFLRVMSFVFSHLDHRIAISPFVAEYVSKDVSLDPQTIEVIYNCSDISRYQGDYDRVAIRDSLGIPVDATQVLCLGVLNEQKRTRLFIEIALRIAPSRPNCHFALAGLGPLREELEARVDAAGLSSQFHFLGHRSDVPELLAVTDLLVFPSSDEGFGRAMTEAMASSVPVIAFDSGACPDVVEDGVTGYVIAEGDLDDMTARCFELLDSPLKRREMGAAGLARARALFDVPIFAERTEASLERVLAAHRSR